MDESKLTPAMFLFHDEKGDLVLKGPLHNKVVCYGLLVAAILATYEHKQVEDAVIVTPPAGLSLVP